MVDVCHVMDNCEASSSDAVPYQMEPANHAASDVSNAAKYLRKYTSCSQICAEVCVLMLLLLGLCGIVILDNNCFHNEHFSQRTNIICSFFVGVCSSKFQWEHNLITLKRDCIVF